MVELPGARLERLLARGGRALARGGREQGQARAAGAGRAPPAGAGSRGGEQDTRVQRRPARAASLASPFRTSKHEEILMWEQTH